jgi:thiamine biosynthesis protein ThiS
MSAEPSIEIQVNGESRRCPESQTVAELLVTLGLKPKFVAVERNEQLVPRAQHADCRLSAGDRIEIVTLVGGG